MSAITTGSPGLYAVTTTFTPAPSCTQSQWTLLPSPDYFIYLNYPDPIPASTHTECYPSAFISSYFEQKKHLTPLPSIAPLICPKGYTTVSVPNQPDGYVACCPSGMGLATSDQAPFTRPAFNGTCYSDVPSTVLVTAYGTESITTTSVWDNGPGQAYAIPIEGYAFVISVESSTSSGSTRSTASPASSPTSNRASATTTTPSATPTPSETNSGQQSTSAVSSNSTSHAGAIAGGVVGGIAGLAAIFALIWFFFIRRRNQPSRNGPPELAADSPWQRTELGSKEEDKAFDPHNPHSPTTHHELDGTDNVVELDAARHSMYKYDRSLA